MIQRLLRAELNKQRRNLEWQRLDLEQKKLIFEQQKHDSLINPAKPNVVEESKLMVDQEKIAIEKDRVKLEQEKVEIEKEKLFLDKKKVDLEQKKLETEKEKLKNNLQAAEIGAKSRRHGAYTRAASTLIATIGAGAAAYLYFRPLENKMKKTEEKNNELKKDLADMTRFFSSAQIDAGKKGEVIKKGDEIIAGIGNKDAINKFNEFKNIKEREGYNEKEALDRRLALKNHQGMTRNGPGRN